MDQTSAIVSRTGYTGEDGFEVILPADHMLSLWEELLQRGGEQGVIACGLGCRDTLRLEAAMPLYGHELSEYVDPFSAGLSFAVKLGKGEFIGREALERIKSAPLPKKRVGLVLEGKRIARENTPVVLGDKTIGVVTSGTFSPTLEKSLGMGYVDRGESAVGTKIEVDIRGKREGAEIVGLPFYKRQG
ncbi:MAG: glycine cleavage T C-terminal barrel domain-containing protein [Planctomycetales bacterium]